MCEPFSAGAILAGVGSAFKFADLAVRIAEVGSENEVFVRTIHVVRDDLREVERLLKVESVQRKLASIPGKLPWVRGAINNTTSALNEIGKWVERARAEQQSTGSIHFNTRVRWVFNDHEKIVNRKTELMACHQQLSNVLSFLVRMEDVPSNAEPPTYQNTTYFDDIISRHTKRRVGTVPENTGVHSSNSATDELRKPSNSQENTSFQKTEGPSPTVDRSASIPQPPMTPSSEAYIPFSPPPTYASAAQTNAHILHTQMNTEHYPDVYYFKQSPSQYSMTKTDVKRSSEAHSEPKGTWAYESAPDGLSVAELVGDTVCLSATNSHGPVNPYEYCASTDSSNARSLSENDETKVLVELLGDLRFATELPSNILGPPPGYPPLSSQRTTYGSDYITPGSRSRSFNQRSSSDLQDVPRYDLALSCASNEPVLTARDLPAARFASSTHSSLSQRTSGADKARQGVAAIELEEPPKILLELPSSDSVTYRRSSSQPSTSTSMPFAELAAGSSMSSGSFFGDRDLPSRYPTQSTELNGPPISSKLLEPTGSGYTAASLSTSGPPHDTQFKPPASTTRMRRQKQMMELLASIES